MVTLTVNTTTAIIGKTILVFTVTPTPYFNWFLESSFGAEWEVPGEVGSYSLGYPFQGPGWPPTIQFYAIVGGAYTNTITISIQYPLSTSATVTIRGKCTGGYPLPSMLLEIYDKGVKIKSKTISVASIGTVYEASAVVTGAGIHRAQGRMVLTNPLGSYEFLTPIKEFTLG